jgi:hypothetical protein
MLLFNKCSIHFCKSAHFISLYCFSTAVRSYYVLASLDKNLLCVILLQLIRGTSDKTGKNFLLNDDIWMKITINNLFFNKLINMNFDLNCV